MILIGGSREHSIPAGSGEERQHHGSSGTVELSGTTGHDDCRGATGAAGPVHTHTNENRDTGLEGNPRALRTCTFIGRAAFIPSADAGICHLDADIYVERA
jgi:hypothetical protein